MNTPVKTGHTSPRFTTPIGANNIGKTPLDSSKKRRLSSLYREERNCVFDKTPSSKKLQTCPGNLNDLPHFATLFSTDTQAKIKALNPDYKKILNMKKLEETFEEKFEQLLGSTEKDCRDAIMHFYFYESRIANPYPDDTHAGRHFFSLSISSALPIEGGLPFATCDHVDSHVQKAVEASLKCSNALVTLDCIRELLVKDLPKETKDKVLSAMHDYSTILLKYQEILSKDLLSFKTASENSGLKDRFKTVTKYITKDNLNRTLLPFQAFQEKMTSKKEALEQKITKYQENKKACNENVRLQIDAKIDHYNYQLKVLPLKKAQTLGARANNFLDSWLNDISPQKLGHNTEDLVLKYRVNTTQRAIAISS